MIESTFASGLVSDGPAEEHRDKLMLYGQFVGDWMADTTEFLPDGSMISSQWDIRFQWVLEGRAIQDLWITPVRDGNRVGWYDEGNRYSTTLRLYDPKIDAWHILWLNPPGKGHIIRQLSRRVGDEIVQLANADESGELSRWVYRDITPDSFRWCNERSSDQGASWRLVQEMRARRV